MNIRASRQLLNELQHYEEGSFEDCLRGEEGTPHTDDPSQHAFSILERRKASISFDTKAEAVTLLASIDNSPEDERRIRPMLRSIERIMCELRQYIESEG